MEKDDWHNLPPNLGAELTNEALSSFLVSVGGGILEIHHSTSERVPFPKMVEGLEYSYKTYEGDHKAGKLSNRDLEILEMLHRNLVSAVENWNASAPWEP